MGIGNSTNYTRERTMNLEIVFNEKVGVLCVLHYGDET